MSIDISRVYSKILSSQSYNSDRTSSLTLIVENMSLVPRADGLSMLPYTLLTIISCISIATILITTIFVSILYLVYSRASHLSIRGQVCEFSSTKLY